MKNLCNLFFLSVIIVFMAFSCEKDDDVNKLIFEIPIEGDLKIINVEKNGLEFKFCLLNQSGEAVTKFNQGKNFFFNFSIANKNNFDISINEDFINENFFRVYQNYGDEIYIIGRPWTGLFCEFNSQPAEFELPANESLSFEIPWIVNPEDNNIRYYPFCFSTQNESIQKGKFYTSLDFDLFYKSINEDISIKNISFKINFEVI